MPQTSNDWLLVKESVNKILHIIYNMNDLIEDPVSQIYDNNLPKAMNDIAIWIFKNPESISNPDVKDNIPVIRKALNLLEVTGSLVPEQSKS